MSRHRGSFCGVVNSTKADSAVPTRQRGLIPRCGQCHVGWLRGVDNVVDGATRLSGIY
jgi:hypothetical protein